MSSRIVKNISASVRQRLLNISRNEQRPFNELLQYYAMERFLYRLSRSAYADRFILKGALMLRAWHSPIYRSTMDIDMLGKTDNKENSIIDQIRDILAVEIDPDGLFFDSASIKVERITENADYEGVRILFQGTLGTARINMQIDIGFGDTVFPRPEKYDLPTILDFPAPSLLGYSRESSIAEKFEAMVKLEGLNSRMKDFYDIWLLSRMFNYTGEKLAEAIRRTFAQRGTPLTDDIVAFSKSFILEKKVQWKAFAKKLKQSHLPDNFSDIVSAVSMFLQPVSSALISGNPIPDNWEAPGPWN